MFSKSSLAYAALWCVHAFSKKYKIAYKIKRQTYLERFRSFIHITSVKDTRHHCGGPAPSSGGRTGGRGSGGRGFRFVGVRIRPLSAGGGTAVLRGELHGGLHSAAVHYSSCRGFQDVSESKWSSLKIETLYTRRAAVIKRGFDCSESNSTNQINLCKFWTHPTNNKPETGYCFLENSILLHLYVNISVWKIRQSLCSRDFFDIKVN